MSKSTETEEFKITFMGEKYGISFDGEYFHLWDGEYVATSFPAPVFRMLITECSATGVKNTRDLLHQTMEVAFDTD